MVRTLYPIGFWFFRLGLRIASLAGHRKARMALKGRRGWQERMSRAARLEGEKNGGRWIHVHCASHGEFEQGAPVLAALRERAPDRPILLTFFSPSGVEAVPPDAADHVDYLPFDTRRNMRRLQEILPAADTVLIKYELWPRLLETRLSSGGRVHLVAARFDAGRHPANSWGAWLQEKLTRFTTVLVQDEESAKVIAGCGVKADVAGDPRVDRVLDTVRTGPPEATRTRLNRIAHWAGNRTVLIAGSAWQGEWDAIRGLLSRLPGSGWCVLVAPHEVHSRAVHAWASESGFPLTSRHPDTPFPPSDGLILDEMGILKYLYGLGNAAMVGGGWGAGVHNTLEPAAFGLPIAVGPNIAGFREIKSLEACGALMVCASPDDMTEVVSTWMAPGGEEMRKRAGAAAADHVSSMSGASKDMASRILKA